MTGCFCKTKCSAGLLDTVVQQHWTHRGVVLMPMSCFAAICLIILAIKIWPSEMLRSSGVFEKEVNNFSSAVYADDVSSPLSPFVRNGEIPYDDRVSLPPLSTLLNYINQHGEQVLWSEWKLNNTEHRRFAVVHYSCPHQLGNRLHHFFNDFLLAFMTNRTVLWKHWTREDCIQLGNKYDHDICINMNRSLSIDNPAECDSIMETAPWIPRYDVWSTRLDLPASPVQIWTRPTNPRNAPEPVPDNTERIQWQPGTSDKHRVAVFQPRVGPMPLKYVEREYVQQDEARSRVRALFHYGHDFLYGALFDQMLQLKPIFLKSVRPWNTRDGSEGTRDLSALSITLHSRHTDPLDVGSNITDEENCLKGIFDQMPTLNLTSCRLFMLSDRPETLRSLRVSVGTKCEVVQAEHKYNSTNAPEAEHGPFAGADFVRDLELASREASLSLRSFWIGHSRSSSKLLREWLTYRRAIWFWKNFGLEPSRLPSIPQCQLPG